MMVSAKQLLGKLPPFTDTWVTVKEDQRVKDIIKQILVAHKKYAGYYDQIALYFDAPTVEGICNKLYRFCKAEIKYNEEPEHDQTTALPTGILTRGYGDCKHYASFCGGVLDALQRLTGKEIDWCYRFVSYKILSDQPHHVFVVVYDGNDEIWIDPVPGANDLEPTWLLDKKINIMPLRDNIGSVFSHSYNDSYREDLSVGVIDPGVVVNVASSVFAFVKSILGKDEVPDYPIKLKSTLDSLASSVAFHVGTIPPSSVADARIKLQKAIDRKAYEDSIGHGYGDGPGWDTLQMLYEQVIAGLQQYIDTGGAGMPGGPNYTASGNFLTDTSVLGLPNWLTISGAAVGIYFLTRKRGGR